MAKHLKYGRELQNHPFNARALLTRSIIVAQRKIFGEFLSKHSLHAPIALAWTGQAANDAIRDLLLAPPPCMISRFGCGEMETTLRHLDISAPGSAIQKSFRLLTGRAGPFWWDNSIRAGITWIAGLFPPTDEIMSRFGELVVNDCSQIDLLASWLAGERRLQALCYPQAKGFPLNDLEPFFFERPWSAALAGKTVLAVHPFEATIRRQYENRSRLFRNPDVLPAFTLKTYKTVQSLAGNATGFDTWFDALNHMCRNIDKIDFDVALIGAGAYGMSLAAHIKRSGRKAIHMGGITQLLFGIKGGRWDNIPRYRDHLYNESWIRPLAEDHPNDFQTVENGSYW